MPGLTPYQTVGPFFDFALAVPGAEAVAGDAARGRITIEGTVLDGASQPVPDALIEIWQADASGAYAHPADPHGASDESGFRGFGRCGTDRSGRFEFQTIVPGRVPFDPRDAERSSSTGLQAPHLVVGVLARGVMTRLVTRMYFDDQPSNAEDAVLQLVPADRRQTLMARRLDDARYQFTIVLQGDGETVFFDV